MRLTIFLDGSQQTLVTVLADERYKRNRARGSRDKVAEEMGAQFADEQEVMSVGSEIAFCLLLGVPDEHVRSPEQLPYDAVLRNGLTVDVKCRRWGNGLTEPMNVKERCKDDPAHLYALMVESWPGYEFAGVTTADKVFLDGNKRNIGRGPYYCVSRRELRFDLIR